MLCNGQDEIEKGLPPTPDTLHLGCSSYHLHTSHRFLSTWGTVTLEKVRKKKKKKKKEARVNSTTLWKRMQQPYAAATTRLPQVCLKYRPRYPPTQCQPLSLEEEGRSVKPM